MVTRTPNLGLVVDPTGSNVDTWADNVTNPDYVAIDGLLGGVQTISATNAPITLTSPAAFVPTPGGGPTQSQNRVLRFTGALSGNVVVTLPIPGAYIVENLTTGAFVLSFRGVVATEVVGTPQGERLEIYNDGANVRFVNLARVGTMEMWAGLSAMPAWVAACTVKPYLLCDGTVYNYSAFPFLGPRLAGAFGGNGATTFGVPDMQGRVPLAYDGTGIRITFAGCGVAGQSIGSSGGVQNNTLALNQIPSITTSGAVSLSTFNVAGGGTRNNIVATNGSVGGVQTQGGSQQASPATTAGATGDYAAITSISGTASLSYTNAGQQLVINVQPSIVTGIWVCKT